ncbi:putative leucine-rich repeat-containing protein DDB_G0290503 [Clytia hemisphaerica]|uniref:putative leucine-rich repeat-containing protein DDB_G0290503 n=1 Tax=Clytia hemisphaerica TaxID=252671 RepID=UPI0034D6DFE5|eukprot:TCONS_00065615-protein
MDHQHPVALSTNSSTTKTKFINNNNESLDKAYTNHDDEDQNLFFMSSAAATGVRQGSGHVTPEDLKNKLMEYKNQLDLVKNMFSHNNTLNAGIDGGKSLAESLKSFNGGHDVSQKQFINTDTGFSDENHNFIPGAVDRFTDSGKNQEIDFQLESANTGSQIGKIYGPKNSAFDTNQMTYNKRNKETVFNNQNGLNTESFLTPPEEDTYGTENSGMSHDDPEMTDTEVGNTIFPDFELDEESSSEVVSEVKNENGIDITDAPILTQDQIPRFEDNQKRKFSKDQTLSKVKVKNSTTTQKGAPTTTITPSNKKETLKHKVSGIKPPKLRIPTPTFRKSSNSTSSKQAGTDSCVSDVEASGSTRIPRKRLGGSSTSSVKNSPKKTSYRIDYTTSKDQTTDNSKFTIKKNSNLNNKPNKRNTSSGEQQQSNVTNRPKSASKANRRLPTSAGNTRPQSSNPISIPKPSLKYERSDSELSSCSNASSYITDRGGAFHSDLDTKPPRTRFTKQRKAVGRSRSSVESSKELKAMYEEKYKSLRDEMEKKIHLQDLSSSLKEQYFDTWRNDLETKCNRYEQHINDLEQKSRDHSTESNQFELKYTKLEFQNSFLCNEYNRLKNEKTEIERELTRCQEMLNQSYSVQKEVKKCLEQVKDNEVSLSKKLKEVQTENEGLKHDLETLKALCMENDERVKYYQQMERRLQECMNGAMLQIANLEKETMQSNVHHKMEFQKLVDQHGNLQREHEAIKILYSDALRRVDESNKEKEDLKRTIQHLHLQSASRELIYSNQSSRNHTPLTQTPTGSPNTARKLSIRRTWFPPEVSFDQFKPTEDSQNSSGNESCNNSKICDLLTEGNNKLQTRIPKKNFLRHRRQHSVSSNNGESDSNESLCSSLSSLRSSTHNLLTPDSEGPNPFGRIVPSPNDSWYVPVGAGSQNKKINERFSKKDDCKSIHTAAENNNSITKNNSISKKDERPQTPNKNKKHKGQSKIGRFHALKNSVKSKSNDSLNSNTPSRPSSAASNHSTKSKKKELQIEKSARPLSAIPTPCGVTKTYLTTEEVLASVQEKPKPKVAVESGHKVQRTSRFEQLCTYRDKEEAQEIVDLEEKLQTLNSEKQRLDTQLGKIPTRSSLRSTSRSAQQERLLEGRADEVARELASVRSALKRLNAF